MKIKKKPRRITEKDGKKFTIRGIELTKCSQTLTNAEFFAMILSWCRRSTLFWRPRTDKLNEGRRTYTGTNKRLKWEYSCEFCNKWFTRREIELDHIVACGGITCFADIGGWYERALCEKDGFRRLCKVCHLKRTNTDRVCPEVDIGHL